MMRSFRLRGLMLILFAAAGCGSNSGVGSAGGTGGAGTGGATTGSGGATTTGTGGAIDAGGGTGGDQTTGTGGAVTTDGGDAPGETGAGGMIADPGTDGDGIVMIASPFKADPNMSDKAGTPKGQVIQFTMANSTTFMDGSRKVGVYVPNGYVSGTEIPFMVAQDGINPQNGGSFGMDDLRPLLDNLIAAGMLPMMAGIFVDPAGQRSVEYDTVSDKYYQFVETELLPAAIAQVQMKANLMLNLTKDPEGRGAFGGSSGGAAAFTMGWFHPESYHRILTLSGSFVNLQHSTMYPDGAAGYPNTLIAANPVKPLRVFLEAGSNDLGGGSWRAANDKMAAALMAKGGYHFRYVQAAGASHEDDGARRQYLPSAMLWLWRGYPIKK